MFNETQKIMKTYHMGLVKKSDKTVILQVVESIDSLSCELWQYFGQRENTITNLKRNKKALLTEVNKSFQTNFRHLLINGY
jgi:hypothetical protein